MSRHYYSESEKRGILAAAVAVLLVAVMAVWMWYHPDETAVPGEPVAVRSQHPRKSAKPYAQPERKVETFPFDPNTADSTTLLRLGLTPPMVRGIYKFRSMGYVYSYPEDFSRVPGMTKGLWARLAPMITIAPEFQPVEPMEHPRPAGTAKKGGFIDKSAYTDTKTPHSIGETAGVAAEAQVQVSPQPKLHEGQTIDVNTADTAQLKQVPGVGSYYATQVVRYRERLGGFQSVEQVTEIKGFPVEALDYLTVSSAPVRKLSINKVSRRALLSHPYLSVEQARAVWEYRRNEGSLHGRDDLLRLPAFRPSDVDRLLPYLDFSE